VSTEPNLRGASALPPEQGDLRRQQEISKSIKGAVPGWISDGKMVSGSLADGDESSITHGLKRVPKGWLLMSTSGDADRVGVVQTGSTASVLKLKNVGATGSLSFALWVF
jgi:hypothetical protein